MSFCGEFHGMIKKVVNKLNKIDNIYEFKYECVDDLEDKYCILKNGEVEVEFECDQDNVFEIIDYLLEKIEEIDKNRSIK